MTFRSRVIDAWSPLSHRAPLAGGRTGSELVPSWVGIDNERRLAAYKILHAYVKNVSRDYREFDTPEAEAAANDYREYGDPKAFRDAIVSALLGYDPPEIIVEGAGDTPPETTDQTADDPESIAARAEIEARKVEAAARTVRQDWLRRWAQRERAIRKLHQGEQHSVGLGDGVWVFRTSHANQRITMRTYEPGYYFPVLDQDDTDEFPRTVHLAWQFDVKDPLGKTRTFVRRQTWRLGPILADADGAHLRTLPDGRVEWVRDYPWNTDPTAPDGQGAVVASATTCYLSDGVWRLDQLGRVVSVDTFTDGAVWAVNETGSTIRDLDLAIDMIPVVHIPNTIAEEEHFGQSAIANVAQLQDEIAAVDTDMSKAAATTGVPMIGATGVQVDKIKVGPGRVINLGTDGNLIVVDTSKSLDALLKLTDRLLDRRDANGRVPSALLGRVDPTKVAAGIILNLSFGPLRAMIGEMRLVRDEKWPLMLKIVQRMSIAAGFLDGPVYEATFEPSSFLPADDNAIVDQVKKLRGDGVAPPLVSTQTALRWLAAAGLDYDDLDDEQEAIESEDFGGAERLLTALGDGDWVDEYLHRTPRTAVPVPPGPDPNALPPVVP